jgi:hypothetical protein
MIRRPSISLSFLITREESIQWDASDSDGVLFFYIVFRQISLSSHLTLRIVLVYHVSFDYLVVFGAVHR